MSGDGGAPPSARERLAGPALVLLLTLLAGGLALTLVFAPGALRGRYHELRHGARPTPGGLLLTLGLAPAGTEGVGPGPWLLVELRNVGREPLPVAWTDPPGGALSLRAWDAEGRALTPRFAPETEALPVRRATLGPGERVGLVIDGGGWFDLGPGRYEVQVERAGFGALDGLAPEVAVSNRLELDLDG